MYIVCAGCAAMLTGCASLPKQPAIERATIEPSTLHPGDAAIITVEFQDQFDIIDRVVGVVKEDTTISFQLKDDGVDPDVEADDNIWTMKVEVPFNAPPGEFTFEAQAMDDNSQVIVVNDKNREAAPLQTSFTLEITYPENP
jgi:hypothetical protein